MSIVFLLLRFLTTPMPVVSAAAVVADADALRAARAQMAAIDAAPARIRVFMRGAQDGPMRSSCVAQRLAEAQVHVVLARDEMRLLADAPAGVDAGAAPASSADRAHALTRLKLIAERTQEVVHAARLCVDDELSTINATRFEVEEPAAVEKRGDATGARAPAYPCQGSSSCTVLPPTP